MNLLHPSGGTSAERFDVELRRTVDRVRGLALTRLEAAYDPEPTRADAVRGLAQRLADDAARLAGEPRRDLPVLAVHAAGDQLAVCGHDLLVAAETTGASTVLDEALDAALDEGLDATLDAATEALRELRRRL